MTVILMLILHAFISMYIHTHLVPNVPEILKGKKKSLEVKEIFWHYLEPRDLEKQLTDEQILGFVIT